MAPQYKRSICPMCTHNEACQKQRWNVYCSRCPESLKCTAREGIGNPACRKLRAAWLDLPRKCLLVSHLVNQKANQGKDNFVSHNTGDHFICPRCQQPQGQIYIDHGLNHLFKRISRYIYTCDYCGVDETVGVV